MSARHWSAAELIAHLYGVGPENEHLASCADCQRQLAEMAETRAAHEAIDRGGEEISDGFLAAQRRQIYGRLSAPRRPFALRRWAPAAAATLIISGGLFVFEIQQHHATTTARVSDNELVEEVGSMAENPEPPALAPLHALFEE